MIARRSFLKMLGALVIAGPSCAVALPRPQIEYGLRWSGVIIHDVPDAAEELDVFRAATAGMDMDAQLSRIIATGRHIGHRRDADHLEGEF